MDKSRIEQRNATFRKHLEAMGDELLRQISDAEQVKNEADFKELKEALGRGHCSMCGYPLSHFTERKPCLHWLLKTKGFKKKHFPLLFEKYSFHRMEAYLRWVANADTPLKNINDLVEEKTSTKKIELTIRYKNLEWSFSCSNSDFHGHQGKHNGATPHYHFQMKVDDRVIINYNGFHVPFHEEDFFGFAVKDGEFPKLKHAHIQGAGVQALFDTFTPEELLDQMVKADNENEAIFNTSTLVEADPGTKISGSDLAALVEERNRTGVPLAKLIRKLPNVKVRSFITPGPGVPDLAKRTPNRRKENETRDL